MAHWIIEDYGFGGQNYRCSNCRESWNDIYFDVSTEDCCPNCHKPINEDETEYIDTPNKHIADNAIIFPQTIGDITFYSKTELFEWVENMQKEFCSPPTGLVMGKVDKPIKIVFEGDIKVEGDDNNIEVTKRLSKMEVERLLLNTFGTTDVGVLDCSNKTEEEIAEINRIVDEFNKIGCTSFRLTSEEIKEILERQDNA